MEVSKGTGLIRTEENDISLKDIIQEAQKAIKLLWKKKWIIILFGFLGIGLGVAVALLTPKKYIGKVTFILEESNDSPLSAYAGIASQFGIDLANQGQSSLFSGDNIMEFLKSRLIVEKALLEPAVINGKHQTLVEAYIDFKELRDKFAKKGLDVKYPLGADRTKFSREQDSILDLIQEDLVKKSITVSKLDKKLGFIDVEVISPREAFSKALAENLVNQAVSFYTKTKTIRSRTNVDRLEQQADSLRLLLNRKTYSVADLQDINRNPARAVTGVDAEIGSRDKMVIQTMYLEIAKNLEITKLAMQKETPVIQIIDSPILPLTIKKIGLIKGALIGGFSLGFVTILVILLKDFLKRIMA